MGDFWSMALKQVMEIYDLLDDPHISGQKVAELLKTRGLQRVQVQRVRGAQGETDFVRIDVPGSRGRTNGGEAPTLGVIGRLGGIGARPARIGLVSDADGAIAALAVALKLADMNRRGDVLPGDVIITTHVCPRAPVVPHEPVPFMGSPVDMETMNRYEVDPAMEAILSVDTTKGNRVLNQRGFAISPTVKEGYILRPSDDLISIMEIVTGRPAVVLPLATQDITPYGNGLYHINSIMQPSTATTSPVVGVAVTTQSVVPGSATGASHQVDIEQVVRFCIETAIAFGQGTCRFYSAEEFKRLVELYGSMRHLQGCTASS